VRLRDVIDGDLRIFFEHQRDPEANRMAAFSARDKERFMAHWSKILGDETVTVKTILFDGRVAGNVVSWDQSGEREVGYWIGREYWGKGVATRALVQFLVHDTVRPLHAHVAKHNLASIRVLEKCGFTISGEATETSLTGEEEVVLRLDERGRGEAPTPTRWWPAASTRRRRRRGSPPAPRR
jgi:RimJ/RimL family protein N-acetyltransferase